MNALTILGGDVVSPGQSRRAPAEIRVESDIDYFARPACEARAYAAGVSDPHCAALHLELAGRYEQMAEALRAAVRRAD